MVAIKPAACSGGLGFVACARHALKDSRPVLGVLDHVAHAQEESLLGEIAAPALAAIKLDIVPAPALGQRMPFANGFDGGLERCFAHARPVPECAARFRTENARHATVTHRLKSGASRT